MLFLKSDSAISYPALLNGLAIFIFSVLSLVIPSGYSYGPALLVLGSLNLIIKYNLIKLDRQDRIFISVLLLYFFVHVCLNITFSLPARSYDGLLRFLLVIPVYLFLTSYPPRSVFFWFGLMFGVLGAGFFAIFQIYFDSVHRERASGHINAIQFGDISFLMASLMLCGVAWAIYILKNKYVAFLFLLSSLFGFCASFLSLSRGGWIAIPLVLYVVFLTLRPATKKTFLASALLGFFLALVALIALPHTNPIKERILETGADLTSLSQGELNSESTSFYTRMQMWKNGIDAFSKSPIIGWGDITAIKNNSPDQWRALDAVDNFNHLHNEYLDALAKHGLVGFIALMALFLIPLKYFLNLMQRGNEEATIFAAAGVVLILCVMVFGLTQTFMAHNSGTTIFAFYLIIIRAYTKRFALLGHDKISTAP